MHNRYTEAPHRSSTGYSAAFNQKMLAKDVLSAISHLLADGEEFPGHDGRQYVIMSVKERETGSETFIDVVVKLDKGDQVVAKYAITLQEISR